MSADSANSSFQYSTKFDFKRYKKQIRGYARKSLPSYVWASLGGSAAALLMVLPSFAMGFYAGPNLSTSAWIVVGMGLLFGPLFVWAYLEHHLSRVEKLCHGKVLTYDFDDEVFAVTSDSGVRISVPWSILRILYERGDVMVLGYEETTLLIDLEPMRANALFDEFSKRLKRSR